jgi:hypothetical protein
MRYQADLPILFILSHQHLGGLIFDFNLSTLECPYLGLPAEQGQPLLVWRMYCLILSQNRQNYEVLLYLLAGSVQNCKDQLAQFNL